MPVLAAAAVFVAVALLAMAAATRVEQRQHVRATWARLSDYDLPGVRPASVPSSVAARLLTPLRRHVLDLVRRVTPAGYAERARHKLVLAGRAAGRDADLFLVGRALSFLAIPALWYVVWRWGSVRGTVLVAVLALVAVAGVVGPDAWLNREVEARQEKIRARLPDVLDLLTISVEAGLGFEQALTRTVSMVPGPLSEEFARMLGEMRAGASRADALTAMDARTEVPELRTFVLSLLQADTFGVSIGTILRTQATEIRNRRRQSAQERAQKAPVKMLFPMVFCIMPALFVVVAGPAVISIFHAFNR